MNNVAGFKIDYGTRVSSVATDAIKVNIESNIILKGYAKATMFEMQRMNPVRFESVAERITEVSLHTYYTYLLSLRVKSIKGELKEWRQARTLWMPAWVQFAISCVGEVVIPEYGLIFTPDMKEDYYSATDMSWAQEISSILRMFKQDGLSVMDDGFPRTRDGNKDTMSLALFGTYVQGPWPVSHPVFTYVAAFLGHKVQEGQGYDMLYRCRYDDINFIASMLLNDEKVLR